MKCQLNCVVAVTSVGPMQPSDPVDPATLTGVATSDELNAADRGALLDAATQCILIHDAATKDILWANPAACAMLEFPLDELRPLKAPDMSSSAQQYRRSIGRAWLQDAVERGHSRTQWRYRSKSGREFPTDALATRVELSTGPVVMVQFRNIERELEMERTLLRTTGLFEALARHSITGALVVGGDGSVEFATDSASAQLGVTREELIGASVFEFGHRLGTVAELLGDPLHGAVLAAQLGPQRPDHPHRRGLLLLRVPPGGRLPR